MPRRQRQTAKRQNEPQTYYIIDSKAEQIAGQDVTAKMKREGIRLTAEQAAYYVASGTISTENPKADKAAADAAAGADAPAERAAAGTGAGTEVSSSRTRGR